MIEKFICRKDLNCCCCLKAWIWQHYLVYPIHKIWIKTNYSLTSLFMQRCKHCRVFSIFFKDIDDTQCGKLDVKKLNFIHLLHWPSGLTWLEFYHNWLFDLFKDYLQNQRAITFKIDCVLGLEPSYEISFS